MDISHHITRDCTPKHATLAVQIPAINSQSHQEFAANPRNSSAQAVQRARRGSASGCTENKGLLTDQFQPLSEASLSRQQAFAASSVNSRCILLAALLRKVDTRQDSWPILPEVMTFRILLPMILACWAASNLTIG